MQGAKRHLFQLVCYFWETLSIIQRSSQPVCPATCYSCGGVFHSTGQIMVGPLTVRNARPLPPDLDEFVSNSGGHGFIIVSFGSHVADLPQEEVDMLATAFGKLKQRVVWRLKGNCHGNF